MINIINIVETTPKFLDLSYNVNKITTYLICSLYEKELDIPGDSIYITFSEVSDWGFNGKLF
ncbi:hypothetical protein [Clostridium kluyveri]|uniref:Uncharacterized protein n=1 Tax=Clostridium kluyveri (strain ATCC 8527 / DSM 555 / NBRC 12016 / NCIMB 10680 / K1) TaxID=431943 RepID=A5N8T3_CLOK5|nr:hypothetical protein [Clostridium kluyveri]EDK33714.1 Conserved hypothetical protein [Clostridium kluyveri DSM 555]